MRITLLAAALAAFALQGCGPEAVAPPAGDMATLRLASASPGAGSLDLLVNGRTVARGVGSTQASAAARVEAGAATGEIRATGSDASLASLPLTLEAGQSYVVLAAGPRQALTMVVSVDTGSSEPGPPAPPPPPVDSGTPPPSTWADAVRFRIVHAAPHAPPLDPYLVVTGAPLDTLPSLQPFAYGSLALMVDLVRRPGHYTVEFTEAGTTQVVLDSGDIAAAAGQLVTVVLGENADRSPRVDVMKEACVAQWC
jgi:Domain of unknown function (DUF4397)